MTDQLRIGRVREDWHLAQHITKPRPAWHELGLKRTRAPRPVSEITALAGRIDKAPRVRVQRKYRNIYRSKDGTYEFRFQYCNVTHRQTYFASEDEAARAYNDYVAQHGMARELLDVRDVRDELEAAS